MEITLDIDKFAKDVVDKALNDIKLEGKTIREWVEIIAKQQLCGAEYGKMLESSKPNGGHWISHNEHCEKIGVKPSGLGAYIWCSNCDCGIDIGEFYRIHYNFCPNCGADMRETRESEDNKNGND